MYNYFMPRKVLDKKTREKGVALAKLIKAERERQNLSQEELAKMADVRFETLKSIECERILTPNVFIVANIAIALKGNLNKWLK